jgi:hypothetical protein
LRWAPTCATNTFTATTIGQSDYALEDAVYGSDRRARGARRAADDWTAKTPDHACRWRGRPAERDASFRRASTIRHTAP